MKTLNVCLFAALLLCVFTACKSNQKSDGARPSVELSGAGATFPLPFYNVAFENFGQKYGDVVAYGGIGSGGGIRNLKDQIVDFAGTDAYLSDKEMAEMPEVIHIPSCMGAVVLAYNLPNIDKLNLSGEIVADIYAGRISKWNDSRIQALNADVKLPDVSIVPCFRSDGSGTTFVFTDYLSKVSEEWKNEIGTGKSVNFPVGQAAKGNPGVAGLVSQTAYSIGYVGSEYAFAQRIPYAVMKNACGELVLPTSESISAAASGDIPADTRTSITNSLAQGAYPISCFTWLVIYKEQNYGRRSIQQAKATIDLLHYVLSDEAQQITSQIHYAPLPKKAVELSVQNLKNMTWEGSPIQ
ncbi:MAG: phosphate ABC transporter substrate-binding protein PstS [Mediterranea massiliensis]|nr:phosphate ABC transporter substrate-binding protein PstS [Mediterranea massiliensis]